MSLATARVIRAAARLALVGILQLLSSVAYLTLSRPHQHHQSSLALPTTSHSLSSHQSSLVPGIYGHRQLYPSRIAFALESRVTVSSPSSYPPSSLARNIDQYRANILRTLHDLCATIDTASCEVATSSKQQHLSHRDRLRRRSFLTAHISPQAIDGSGTIQLRLTSVKLPGSLLRLLRSAGAHRSAHQDYPNH